MFLCIKNFVYKNLSLPPGVWPLGPKTPKLETDATVDSRVYDSLDSSTDCGLLVYFLRDSLVCFEISEVDVFGNSPIFKIGPNLDDISCNF
jgi:hypothetical protein